MIKNRTHNSSHSFKKPRPERMSDLSKQDNFLFNKTPILASALQKLKKHESNDKKKQVVTPSKPKNLQKQQQQIDSLAKPIKKVKKTSSGDHQPALPSFAFTPLQKDLYNFYTINKISLKSMETVPEPKFQVGSLILTAICDRGIGGKYLVTNLFRNKKGYIDYREVSQARTGKDDFAGIQAYYEPGNFVIATVVKSINQNHLQLSLSKFIEIESKSIKIGQTIPAEIKSKQEMGCHLIVYKCKDYKFFLPKADLDEQIYDGLLENTQIIITVTDIDHAKSLIKVQLASEEHTGLNLRGVQEQQMSKIELQQYVSPGTLVNTKVVKILKNGVMVKFLKIFVGFIHCDHLLNPLQFYTIDTKIQCRIIYSCLNPPLLYLSQKHVNLNKYNPKRALYSAVNKPANLSQVQNSYFSKQDQLYIHPTQLHSEIENITKFWVKENNYFERYQIMTSRKLGLRLGEVAKEVPFNNFKVYGDGNGDGKADGGRFRVMCLDVWNKVVKVSYDEKFVKSTAILCDVQDIDLDKQYCGIIKLINENGITVQFCNNIRGILSKKELKTEEKEYKETSIGKSIQVYVSHVKSRKNFLTLSLIPPIMRNKSKNQAAHKNKGNEENLTGEESYYGTIASVDPKSIHPIYIKLKSTLVKISVFNGIRPPSVQDLPIIKDLASNFQVGQKIRVFRKGKQYFLYPPEQLSDKNLRICKVVGQKGSLLRLQVGRSEFKNCHICDITDLITPYPFAELTAGQYKIGRVLNNGMICLRDSIVMNGIPKSMIQCKQKYQNDELRGDYRNRVLTVGSAGLKQNMVMFGYVKNYSEKGCFVSVAGEFEVRIQLCELSDQHIVDKAKLYPMNKLMLIRLISQKVKPNDPSKHLFDASARESVIKMGYPINEEALMVGLTVSGKVSGYVKGKALIKLDGSKFTGIMNPSEVESINREEPIEKSMKLGTNYTMKIIQLSNDGRRLIRLSTLSKYFNKYKGVELNIQNDENSINLWQNYQQLLQEEAPARGIEIGTIQHEGDEQNSEDQYDRIRKLVEQEHGEDEDDDHVMQEQSQQNEQQVKVVEPKQKKPQQQKMKQPEDEQDQQDEQDQEEEDQHQMLDQQEQSSSKINKPQILQQTLSKQQISRRLSQFRKISTTPLISQSIILANDASQSHLQYISSMISNPNVTPEQIRQQFQKSISMLQTIKDKQNMWIAWLNMELILGDFMGLVKKAINEDAGLNVYNRIVEILREQDKWDVAYEMARKMLRKFNKDIKAYTLMLRHMVLEEVNNRKQSVTLRQLLQRASQSLKAKDLITIESHYGKILYEQKKPEQARTVFSNILAKAPKRTDLWSMYVDLQLKHGTLDKARQILQRCLTVKLKRKKIISILKKYHEIQQKYGTTQSAQQILQRAQDIAKVYEDQREEQGESDD